jgi:hypothetical protein
MLGVLSVPSTILGELAFALGGKAGERISPLLSMAVSHDTLLRLLKRWEAPAPKTPGILGVDDFAWKKGRRYGTILIDQETHTVVDVLASSGSRHPCHVAEGTSWCEGN